MLEIWYANCLYVLKSGLNPSTKPLKPRLGRKRHELDSPSLDGHLPYHPTPTITFPSDARKWNVVGKDNWEPLPSLSNKRSQDLTSPQKKPTALDRPSSVLRGNC
ncbi:hypothetical protein AVEN_207289-1 [Araneus ventricosus]|uniref:Uncharacterized protein n=1 Tax=Araneus ventricosus TaxID=182803 RepID=A0A4Y2R986_ARAVE|nr:hypothetical protein AVEN_207289-1 [Araneus ventricosus]